MAITNQFVSALVAAGADAMSNMYDVEIQFPWDDSATTLTVRADGFKVPEPKVETYENKYHGSQIKLPRTEQGIEKEFELTFRWDASYNLWGQFMTWLSSVTDPVSGGVANWAGVLGQVTVRGLTGAFIATGTPATDGSIANDDRNAIWKFNNVYVIGCGQPDFKTADAAAMTYAVKFVYHDTPHYPFMNGAGLVPAKKS